MEDNNKLNIFKVGYMGWRHPFHNIRQFFHNLAFAWQRATRGYSNYDLYELHYFYHQLIMASLEDFRKSTHSYPYDLTPEKWDQILKQIVATLREGLPDSHTNEWWDRFDFYWQTHTTRETLPDGSVKVDCKEVPQMLDLKEKWLVEEKRIQTFEDEKLKEGMELLLQYWNHLWD